MSGGAYLGRRHPHPVMAQPTRQLLDTLAAASICLSRGQSTQSWSCRAFDGNLPGHTQRAGDTGSRSRLARSSANKATFMGSNNES